MGVAGRPARAPGRAQQERSLVKVAIVGGGCAGIAAAWELGKLNLDPTHPQIYEITVYDKAQRLGGKGSSWRDGEGRIREHGLHIWLGFYENAFRMMREVYAEAGRLGMGPGAKAPHSTLAFASFEEAFVPEAHVGVASRGADGQAEAWTGWLPPMRGQPGQDLDEQSNPFTLAAYLARCVGLSLALMHSVIGPAAGPAVGAARPNERSSFDEQRDLEFAAPGSTSPQVWVERMARWLEVGLLAGAAGVLQGASIVENWLRDFNPLPQYDNTVLKTLEALATQTRRRLRKFADADLHVRRKTQIIDLIMTIVVGLYRDRVLFDEERGLDAIDDVDCKQWLRKHGALNESIDSPFVTGLYDLAFCYENGDPERPRLAAGQAIRGALRMFFSYRGSIFWRMRAGMGETVFSPLYRALASARRYRDGKEVKNSRPVKFEFGHTLERVVFERAGEELAVSELHFGRDALAGPLLDHLGCWQQDRATKHEPPLTLRCRADRLATGADEFDAVVLALGIADFEAVVKRSKDAVLQAHGFGQRLRDMFREVKTIATQSAQVWLDVDLPSLGWTRGPVLVSANPYPLETWADMTHTLPSERLWRERHPAADSMSSPLDGARSAVYFCGVLPDQRIGERRRNRAALEAALHEDLQRVLRRRMHEFWPRTANEDWAWNKRAIGKLTNQHVQVNFEGSERFTLALPGSARFRISPLDRAVVNMTLAGDWTSCGFNESCVESAVMSGMLAAHAISGRPALHEIVGYDHP